MRRVAIRASSGGDGVRNAGGDGREGVRLMASKYLVVNLLRREELPSRLPEVPEQLAELPQVRTAFESLYQREPSPEERQRVRLSVDREWLVVQMPEEKLLLSTGEVAQRLGYSDDQVRRMCEDGCFCGNPARGVEGAYRACVGVHWRIPAAAVELFLKQRRAQIKKRGR